MARHFSGAQLRTARIDAGLTPEHLALRVGRSVWSIYAYERGLGQPPLEVAARIAAAVGCSVDDLLAEGVAHAAV